MTTPHSVVWRIPEPTSPIRGPRGGPHLWPGTPPGGQLLMRRGLVGEELALYLSPDLARLEDPAKIRNMEAAVRVMDEADPLGPQASTIYARL